MKYYLLSILFICGSSALFFLLFRVELLNNLQEKHHLSNSRVKKLKKGRKNFWWLEAFHREFGFSLLYRGNQIASILYVITAVLYLTLGYGNMLAFLVYALLMLLLMTLNCMTYAQELTLHYGTWLVFFGRKNRRKGVDSILFLPCIALAGGMLICAAYRFLIVSTI